MNAQKRGTSRAALLLLGLALGAASQVRADCPPSLPAWQMNDPQALVAPDTPKPPAALRTYHPAKNGVVGYCVYQPALWFRNAPQGIVFYNHGAQLAEDGGYDPMLRYLAQAGYYVIYPELPVYDMAGWPGHSLKALQAGLAQLRSQGVQVSRLAVAGHSLGAATATQVAALWQGSPAIGAIILHEPAGRYFYEGWNWQQFTLNPAGLARISGSTYLLIVQAQSSQGDQNSSAHPIWDALPQIPKLDAQGKFRKNFLLLPDDVSHQNRYPYAVRASDHLTVLAKPLNSMDHYGYWRPTVEALYEAFHAGQTGSPGYSAFCNSSSKAGVCKSVRYTGAWKIDGVEATELKNAADLGL